MTESKCKACDSNRIKRLANWRQYEIFSCKNCHLLFSGPDPSSEELNQFYQGFLHRKPRKKDVNKIVARKIRELKSLFKINDQDIKSRKKILDFGGGVGLAYFAAKEMGLDSYYHDIDKESIKFVNEVFDLPQDKFIRNLKEKGIKFDYIFVDNVIEHVIDPEKFIAEIHEQLNPSGTLVFKTPNARNSSSFFYPRSSIEGYFMTALKYNSFWTSLRFYFSRSWHCDPPRHLFSFSEKSLIHLASNLKISERDYEISYYQHSLFEFSYMKSFLFVDRDFKGLKSIFVRFIAFPVILLELGSKVIQYLLYKLGLISAVGITLTIKK